MLQANKQDPATMISATGKFFDHLSKLLIGYEAFMKEGKKFDDPDFVTITRTIALALTQAVESMGQDLSKAPEIYRAIQAFRPKSATPFPELPGTMGEKMIRSGQVLYEACTSTMVYYHSRVLEGKELSSEAMRPLGQIALGLKAFYEQLKWWPDRNDPNDAAIGNAMGEFLPKVVKSGS